MVDQHEVFIRNMKFAAAAAALLWIALGFASLGLSHLQLMRVRVFGKSFHISPRSPYSCKDDDYDFSNLWDHSVHANEKRHQTFPAITQNPRKSKRRWKHHEAPLCETRDDDYDENDARELLY